MEIAKKKFIVINWQFFASIYEFSALQIPPEAWLRISLNHASITWISIQPSGRVTLRQLGDSGHMPKDLVTSR